MHTEVQRSRMNATGSATVMVSRVLPFSQCVSIYLGLGLLLHGLRCAWHVTDGYCTLGLLQEQEEDTDAMLKEWER